MARISTYPLDSTINDGDKLIGTDADQSNKTKNFSLSGVADYVLDKFIDPDATDFHVPVFNQGGTRITDSIISQDSVTGTSITVGGDFAVTGGASVGVDLTVEGVSYLQGHVYTNSNVDLGDTALDTIKQNGTLELLGPVKDSTGTKGNTEQVLVSNAQGELVWENYQGSGLEYQAGWDADTNVPDLTSTAPTASDTGKYWVVSTAGTTNLGGITDWSPGDWAIVSQNNENVVFWNKIDNSSVDGAGVTDKLAVWTSEKTLGTAPITINGNDASFAGDILLEEDQEVNFEVGGRVSGGDYLDLAAGNASITVGIDNELQFKTGNSTVVTIDEEQNVGIGITDPKAKLHVDDGNALITNTQNADVKVKRKNGAEVLVRSNSTFGYIGTMDDTQFQIRQNGNPVARFNNDDTNEIIGATTITGDLTADNLSGTNTGDQVLTGYLKIDGNVPLSSTLTNIVDGNNTNAGVQLNNQGNLKSKTLQSKLLTVEDYNTPGYSQDWLTNLTITPIQNNAQINSNKSIRFSVDGENKLTIGENGVININAIGVGDATANLVCPGSFKVGNSMSNNPINQTGLTEADAGTMTYHEGPNRSRLFMVMRTNPGVYEQVVIFDRPFG